MPMWSKEKYHWAYVRASLQQLQKNFESRLVKVLMLQQNCYKTSPDLCFSIRNKQNLESDKALILIYRMRAIITRGLHTFYPLFESHLCNMTFGLSNSIEVSNQYTNNARDIKWINGWYQKLPHKKGFRKKDTPTLNQADDANQLTSYPHNLV